MKKKYIYNSLLFQISNENNSKVQTRYKKTVREKKYIENIFM